MSRDSFPVLGDWKEPPNENSCIDTVKIQSNAEFATTEFNKVSTKNFFTSFVQSSEFWMTLAFNLTVEFSLHLQDLSV